MRASRIVFSVGCVIGLALVLFASARCEEPRPLGSFTETIPAEPGVCLVIGPGCEDRALALARRGPSLVCAQVATRAVVDRLRSRAEREGVASSRLCVTCGPAERLHLASNLADLVIVAGGDGVAPEVRAEILRVLRPGGRAEIGRDTLTKPLCETMDDWSHPYHGPDNNPVSEDQTIRAPFLTQYLGEPRYGPAPQAAVASAGRLFKAFGHVAWHEREEPLLNTLVCFNAFNGAVLWKKPLAPGRMVHRNTMIATPEYLYLAGDKACHRLDARTGRTVDTIAPPESVTEGTFWKWMALDDGILYALIGNEELADDTMRWKRKAHGWPWNEISRGFNVPENPWGFGRTVVAIDPESQEVRWSHREEMPIDSRGLCMRSGKIFAFRFGEFLTCLDASSGDILWRRTPDNAPELFELLGEALTRQGWQTNWRTAVYLRCSDEAVYFAGPQVRRLIAVSAQDGRVLWQHPYDNFQLVLHESGLFAISGPWGDNTSKLFHSLTGEVLAELPTGRRACTRPTATADSVFYRAMGGSVRLDVDAGLPRWISPMRPPCHDGVTIANGLLFWSPYVCDCQFNLNGLTCLGSAGDFDFRPDRPASQRLETYERDARSTSDDDPSSADWPTFRANNRRTAVSAAPIDASAELLWTKSPSSLARARLTAPVVVGEHLFVADSEGNVTAMSLDDGREVWRVRTGGEIRIPPTVWRDRVLFGSGDGWVYSVDRATGKVLWRFRAAPRERLMPVYGKLLSTWPAASGVLVEEDTAYVAAGIANYDGTYVYALDALSGEVRWCNATSGHLDADAKCGVSVQGHLLSNDGKLFLAGGNAVSPAVYQMRDGRCLNDPESLTACESTSPRGWELFLVGSRVVACGKPFYSDPEIPVYDHTVTRKLLHAPSGAHHVVWRDASLLQCFPPLSGDALTACVTDEKIPRHVTQAWGRFQVDTKPRWEIGCKGSQAVAVGASAVVVADQERIAALKLDDGRAMWIHLLPATPVPWGVALARDGRVVVTMIDGDVACFGSSN